MRRILLFITLPLLLIGSSASSVYMPIDNADQALVLLDKMQSAIDKNTSIRCGMKKTERWEGKYVHAEYGIKATYKGNDLDKLYIYNEAPSENKGVEILYRSGENKGNCMVHPNGFPYVTVSLDPQGSQLRKKGAGHHCCLSVGFKYMGNKIKALRKNSKPPKRNM